MPRPIRIEYEHAFYHVMNRGRARQWIFHDKRYYQLFLQTLSEAAERFGCIIHAYCLMGNHYHLLIETPNANLGRVMRHINGVYTQRYNRITKVDGALFRGRYKAILVEQDEYLLQLSRYIHRNPIDMNKPLVERLEDYQWSSFPAYIGHCRPPAWLARDKSYQMLGHKQKYKGYKNYVLQGVDEDTQSFYSKVSLSAVLASESFKSWVYDSLIPQLSNEQKVVLIQPRLTMENIVEKVAVFYGINEMEVLSVRRGRQKNNEARKVAMYLCQSTCATKLTDIAAFFNLSHPGSASYAIHSIKVLKLKSRNFSKRLDQLEKMIVVQ